MTKCSAFPRVFGTLPAGSAVRVKSRFALYSARGFEDAARVRPFVVLVPAVFRGALAGAERFAVDGFPVDRFAVDRFAVERFAVERFAVECFPLEREAAFAPLFPLTADFLAAARLRPDFGPDRLVAMPVGTCQEHASRRPSPS